MTITTVSRKQPSGQWLSLYRPDKHDHFDASDKRVLEQLMPHLVEALDINRMLGSLHPADSGTQGTRALARLDGTLYHCGKGFAALMREVWPEWRGGRLPTDMMPLLHPERETVLDGHALAVSVSALGGLLFLNLRRVSPLRTLSPRELEVARLYVDGHTHKEIGVLLNITPATVRNFLARIYTKMKIGCKLELASLLALY